MKILMGVFIYPLMQLHCVARKIVFWFRVWFRFTKQNIDSRYLSILVWGRKCYSVISSTWHSQTYSQSKVLLKLNKNRMLNEIVFFSSFFNIGLNQSLGFFISLISLDFFLIEISKMYTQGHLRYRSVFSQSCATKTSKCSNALV